MDPYRQSGFSCPSCREVPLRSFQERLCCDECRGMFLDEKDLAAACVDLSAKLVTIDYGTATPTDNACPRCDRPLGSVEAVVQPSGVKATFLRCETDGVWCSEGTLEALFAKMARRGKASARGGGLETMSGVGLTNRGLDGVARRSGAATAGLRISQWHQRQRKRASTLTAINAFADRALHCPVCSGRELTFVGDRYLCASCSGAFVQNAAFEALVREMTNDNFMLPAASGDAGPRGCPICTIPMQVETHGKVAIDRCTAHGLWFDPAELEATLAHAGTDQGGLRAWLARLFT